MAYLASTSQGHREESNQEAGWNALGANSRILRKVYVETVRSTLKYDSSVWATASIAKTSRLHKVQNQDYCWSLAGWRQLPSKIWISRSVYTPSKTDTRWRYILVYPHENLRHMITHPMHIVMQNLAKSKLKRTSFNHLSKSVHRNNEDLISTSPTEIETLLAIDDPDNHFDGPSVIVEISGIEQKDCQAILIKIYRWRRLMTSTIQWVEPQTDHQKKMQWRTDDQVYSINTHMKDWSPRHFQQEGSPPTVMLYVAGPYVAIEALLTGGWSLFSPCS